MTPCDACPFAACPECDYRGGAVRFVTLADPTTRLDVPTNRARPAGNRALTNKTVEES